MIGSHRHMTRTPSMYVSVCVYAVCSLKSYSLSPHTFPVRMESCKYFPLVCGQAEVTSMNFQIQFKGTKPLSADQGVSILAIRFPEKDPA